MTEPIGARARVPTERAITAGAGTTRDSLTVACWTTVSRITGALRVLAIAAVLGPTALGNSFQLTNALPNLIFYGFLAGSLTSSVLVPFLVARLDRGDVAGTARVAGGLMGTAALAVGIIAPFVVVLLPQALWLAAQGGAGANTADQIDIARWLIVMMIPQVFGYLVIGTSGAVMHAQHRFALTAAVPAVENCVLIGVLILHAVSFGAGRGGSVSSGELLLLGLGSTLAVAIAATLQWFGARACGVRLRPRLGWRDPAVRAVVRRALPAIGQSALVATQVLVILLISSRVAGGTVAMQIALNFVALPVAIIGTPIALALLPRLSRLQHRGATTDVTDAFVRGIAVLLVVTVPVACLEVVLAMPIAEVVGVGQMDNVDAQRLVAVALAATACGLIGQSVFIVSTQAAYATGRVRTPLLTMAAQAVLCLGVCGIALAVTGSATLTVLGIAFSVANLGGGALVLARLRQQLPPGRARLGPTLVRVVVAGVVLGAVATVIEAELSLGTGRLEDVVDIVVVGVVGVALYSGLMWLMRAPELTWLRDSLARSGRGGAS